MDNVFGNSYALLLALVLAIFTLGLARTSFAKRAPVLLHNVGWIFCLTLIGTDLIRYNSLSTRAWLVITIGILAFNLGMLIPATGPAIAGKVVVGPLVSARVFTWMLAGYAIGHVFYIRAVVANVGVSAFLGQAYKLRETQSSDAFLEAFPVPAKLLFYLGPLLFILAVNGWTVAPALKRRTRLAVTVYLLISLISSLQRSNLLQPLMWQLGLLLIRPPQFAAIPRRQRLPAEIPTVKRRRRTLVASVLLVAVSIAGFQVIAVARRQTSENDLVAQGTVNPLLQNSGMMSLAIYATSGIPAFSNLLDGKDRIDRKPPAAKSAVIFNNYDPQTWGRSTGRAFLKLFPIAEPWSDISPFTRTPIATNVYTWYEPYYRDFREPGVILLTFLSGLVIAYVHRRRGLGPHYLLAAALLVGCSGRAPFANQLNNIYTMEPLIILAVIGWRRRLLPAGRREFPDPRALQSGSGSARFDVATDCTGRER